MVRRSGLGWVRSQIEPTSSPESPRSMKRVPSRITGPDAHHGGTGTTTDRSGGTIAAPETRASTANGTTTTPRQGTRTTAADGNGATSSQRNPAEDPTSHGRSETSSRRRREPPPGSSSGWWSTADEPADPMCVHWGWRGGRCAPPSTPRRPAPGRGSRESARPRRPSSQPVRHG